MIAWTLPEAVSMRQTAFLPRHGTEGDVGWLVSDGDAPDPVGRSVDPPDASVADIRDPGRARSECDLAGQHAFRNTEPLLDLAVQDADARNRRRQPCVEIGGRLRDPEGAGAGGDEQRRSP